ncbi:hypothetical protein L2Y90_25910 [Burkholderia pyrrocinia]|uniref:hypothetical protein n=1 Tax=Burkholderia pyrrocinia TaxID=60550 RepID=UPI00215B5B55|nr:hypothetical protein [Burkholderia pyrrocinia]UVE69946.1 hypothetical protein L2Y90_25910 [Burkholderia pyrrocinia]
MPRVISRTDAALGDLTVGFGRHEVARGDVIVERHLLTELRFGYRLVGLETFGAAREV